MKARLLFCAGLSFAMGATTASAVVVDFASLANVVVNSEPPGVAPDTAFNLTEPFTIDGFTFTPLVGHYDLFSSGGADRPNPNILFNIDSQSLIEFDDQGQQLPFNRNSPMTLEITSDSGPFSFDAITYGNFDFQGELQDTPVFRLEADLFGGGIENGFIPENGIEVLLPDTFNGVTALRFVQQGSGFLQIASMEFSAFTPGPGDGGSGSPGMGDGNPGMGGGSPGMGNGGPGDGGGNPGTGGGGSGTPSAPTPIPLPAAGWFLLAGLAALRMVGRRAA